MRENYPIEWDYLAIPEHSYEEHPQDDDPELVLLREIEDHEGQRVVLK